jgi:hypothetical protein
MYIIYHKNKIYQCQNHDNMLKCLWFKNCLIVRTVRPRLQINTVLQFLLLTSQILCKTQCWTCALTLSISTCFC